MEKIVILGLLMPALAFGAEKPWLVVNEDNDHYFKLDASYMTREALEKYADGIAQGHVTHFFMCVNGQRTSYDSKTWEPIWAGLDEPNRFGKTRDVWPVNAKKLHDAGIDPYAVWTKRFREKGVSPWISMRMNDVHFANITNYFRSTRFCRQRRDLWRVPDADGKGPWEDCALDYARREVREYALAQVREIAERWDSDGIELDWMRFGMHFRPGHERRDAHFLTDFMRRARGIVNEAAKAHDRPMKLAVRVPHAPDVAEALGYEVQTWAKEGLVDVVIGHSFLYADQDIAVKNWTAALKRVNPKVVFLPGIDIALRGKNGKTEYLTAAQYRTIADRFYAEGATGLYLFNAPYLGRYDSDGGHGTEDTFSILCAEGLAPETVRAGEKAAVKTAHDFPPKGRPRNVPDLMRLDDGTTVTTMEQWRAARRPQILETLQREEYGRRPEGADRPAVLRFETAEPDRVMMDGKALRRRIRCVYGGRYGETNFTFTAFIPRQAKPAPAFILICNRNPAENIDPERVKRTGFWPAEQIVDRGYAAIAFWNGDIAPDTYWRFDKGVFDIFQKCHERDDESWGVLSAWAWGASRVMDWIEREPLLDAKHVGVVGHSRGGKTALVAGALDTRFAMTCSNDSGCGGAKLNHMELPESESIDIIWNAIGFWFCGNFRKYIHREMTMPFDQHWLGALIAPRLLAVASASEDNWAGQEGEFEMCRLASPAWALYGERGLVGDRFPGADRPLQEGCVSYHMRTGIHNLTPYDWDRYMDFADRHGWRGLVPFPEFSKPRAITSGPHDHFFANYFGINAWSPDNRYALVLETDIKDHLPDGAPCTLGVVDTQDGNRFIPVTTTRCWNFQEAAMAHWLPWAKDTFVFNDMRDGRFCAVIMNWRTKEERLIPGMPVSAVSEDGEWAVSINYARLFLTRPDYGYAGDGQDPRKGTVFPADDGLFRVNMRTGEAKLIVSCADVKGMVPEVKDPNGMSYLCHTVISKDGKRVYFLSRSVEQSMEGVKKFKGVNWQTTAFTCNGDGTEIRRCFPDGWGSSHFNWKPALSERDARTMTVTCKWRNEVYTHVEFTVGEEERVHRLAGPAMDFDGHCIYTPDGNFVSGDTYWNKNFVRPWKIVRLADQAVRNVGDFFVPEAYRDVYCRCDLHPRWRPDGRMIGFNSVHEGTRQVYVMDVKEK